MLSASLGRYRCWPKLWARVLAKGDKPQSIWKGAENIGKNAGVSLAATAGFNVVREFLSDVLHRPNK
jgi:hypothetical protein